MLELVSWNIRGMKPLMQSNFVNVMERKEDTGNMEAKKKSVPGKAYDDAANQLYRTEDGKFYHPMHAFWASLVTVTGRTIGGEAITTIVARAVEPAEEEFILLDPDTLTNKEPRELGEADWVVDTRRVVNKKSGGILASRPKWRTWGGIATFQIDTDVLARKSLGAFTQAFNIAGRHGIGCGRTRRDGMKWVSIHMGKYEAELRD
jgi:hypothetical protein